MKNKFIRIIYGKIKFFDLYHAHTILFPEGRITGKAFSSMEQRIFDSYIPPD